MPDADHPSRPPPTQQHPAGTAVRKTPADAQQDSADPRGRLRAQKNQQSSTCCLWMRPRAGGATHASAHAPDSERGAGGRGHRASSHRTAAGGFRQLPAGARRPPVLPAASPAPSVGQPRRDRTRRPARAKAALLLRSGLSALGISDQPRGISDPQKGSLIHHEGSLIHQEVSLIHHKGSVIHCEGPLIHREGSLIATKDL